MAQGVYYSFFFLFDQYTSACYDEEGRQLRPYFLRSSPSILTLYTQVAITDSLDFEAVARDLASTPAPPFSAAWNRGYS